MNSKLGNRLIEISRALKPRKATGQHFHTSFIAKKNKIVCIGWNDYNKLHRTHKFGEYMDYKGYFTKYQASCHAETAAIIRYGEEDLRGHEIINVRIGNNNQVCLSKFCINCYNLLKSLSPKRMYYSTNEGTFEESP